MFSKILVANRGEIAVRIVQACRQMGIRSVAVYSDIDAAALHVRRADEAVCIGRAPAVESYLNIGKVVQAALDTGAEAIHPGYGFLAENPEFARAVIDAGLVWIGPDPEVIALLGDKVAAKKLADKVGVPTVPGSSGEDQSLEGFQAAAAAVGYPVMLKAAAGGGGKGMRIVYDPADLPSAVEAAKREARSAFGDDRIFLERAIEKPRHIEIQILLDRLGNGVYLGERECSLQRRHQKVVEEAPSPVMTADLRSSMGEDALRLARAAGYTNAGTVEFLFGGDRYYFLEVNTRIQVEHPVTEMVTGIDLVQKQIEIAAGEPLRLSQLDVSFRGHAVEARVYAEDPAAGFLPSTGEVVVFMPPQGPGIRNDVGIEAGDRVTQFYDPLLAKLIVHAASRDEAVRRLRDALSQYAALGSTTNLGFLGWICEQRWFQEGRFDVETLGETWHPDVQIAPPVLALIAGAVFAVAEPSDESHSGPSNPWHAGNAWRVGGMPRTFQFEIGGVKRSIALSRQSGNRWRAAVEGEVRVLEIQSGANGSVLLREGNAVWPAIVARVSDSVAVFHRGRVHVLRPPAQVDTTAALRTATSDSLLAPMPGTVVKVAVREGETVTAHQPLVILEAMKMEHVIEAPHDGVVREILFDEGDLVPANEPVVRLEST